MEIYNCIWLSLFFPAAIGRAVINQYLHHKIWLIVTSLSRRRKPIYNPHQFANSPVPNPQAVPYNQEAILVSKVLSNRPTRQTSETNLRRPWWPQFPPSSKTPGGHRFSIAHVDLQCFGRAVEEDAGRWKKSRTSISCITCLMVIGPVDGRISFAVSGETANELTNGRLVRFGSARWPWALIGVVRMHRGLGGVGILRCLEWKLESRIWVMFISFNTSEEILYSVRIIFIC